MIWNQVKDSMTIADTLDKSNKYTFLEEKNITESIANQSLVNLPVSHQVSQIPPPDSNNDEEKARCNDSDDDGTLGNPSEVLDHDDEEESSVDDIDFDDQYLSEEAHDEKMMNIPDVMKKGHPDPLENIHINSSLHSLLRGGEPNQQKGASV